MSNQIKTNYIYVHPTTTLTRVEGDNDDDGLMLPANYIDMKPPVIIDPKQRLH